jgi:hypothetical protein
MQLKITEFDSDGRTYDPMFCSLDQFKEVNADGIDPSELDAIEKAVRAGSTYRLAVAVGAYANVSAVL